MRVTESILHVTGQFKYYIMIFIWKTDTPLPVTLIALDYTPT